MRSILSLFSFLVALYVLSVPAMAQYRLQPGDTVEIWVAQQASLSRDLVITPDGRLSLPLAGHLQVQGLTLEELESALIERLRTFFKEKLDLTVMLRPSPQHLPTVFVMGDVNTPGAYPFRLDMTILHAVSVSGGLFRSAMVAGDRDRAIVVQSDIDRSRERLMELEVRTARLQAELDGRDKVELPPNSPLEVNNAVVKAMVVQEQQVLERRHEEISVQTEAKKRIDEIADRSSEAARERFGTVGRRIELAKQQLASKTTLVEKGLAHVSQRLELESMVAELEGLSNQLQTEMATAESALVAERARLEGVIQERRTRLLIELRETQRQSEELRARLADNARVLSVYADAPQTGNAKAAARVVEYRIVRSQNGKTDEFVASETSMLMPGDLVRVAYANAPSSSSAPPVGSDPQQTTGLGEEPVAVDE